MGLDVSLEPRGSRGYGYTELRVVHSLQGNKGPNPQRVVRMFGPVHSRAAAILIGLVRQVELLLFDDTVKRHLNRQGEGVSASSAPLYQRGVLESLLVARVNPNLLTSEAAHAR